MATLHQPPTPAEARRHLMEVLREFDTAMVSSRAADGTVHGRPMAIARVDDNGTVYFCTDINSPKIDEIARDAEVLVTVQSKTRFASVTGLCRLNRDRALIEELWSPSWKAWFTGKDDPSIVLIEVHPRTGEYWDNAGMRGVAYVFEALKAAIAGPPTDVPAGSNAKVDLTSRH